MLSTASNLDVTDRGRLDTVPKLIAHHIQTKPTQTAYREKEFGIWQSWTWQEAGEEMRALAMGMMGRGLKPGDHVAIIGRNRPYFYWAMIACQSVGAIPVPIYQDSVATEMAYVLDHCSARFIIAENQEQVDKILEIQSQLKNLDHVIYVDPRGMRKYDHTKLSTYRDIQNEGRDHADTLASKMDDIITKTTGQDTCAMLYTSGTTGRRMQRRPAC